MKKYYTIENQETKAIDNKFYSIYIEGMQYGNLIRRTNNFSQALEIYRDLKSKFNINLSIFYFVVFFFKIHFVYFKFLNKYYWKKHYIYAFF